MSSTVRIKTKTGDVVFEFDRDGLYVYTGYCGGGRVSRRKAKRLRRLLKAWLRQS